VTQVIENVNVEDWKSANSHVKKIEADYWARDCLSEEETEHVVIKFSGENTDTDSSNDSHSSISGREADDDADGVSGTGINAIAFVTEKCAFLVLHCVVKV
jgi:hypothetical protein